MTARTRIRQAASAFVLALALSGVAAPAWAADPEPKPYAEIVAPLVRQDGLLPIFVDEKGGRVLVQLPVAAEGGTLARVIHHTALRTGVGSSVTGLDRAQIGATNILVYDTAKRLVEVIDVKVGHDLSGIQADMSAALPGEPIKVSNLAGGLMLSGEVSTSSVAARSYPPRARGPVSIDTQKQVPAGEPQCTASTNTSARRAT